jgi:hypothetical protein
MKVFIRTLAAGALAGLITLFASGCVTTGQFSSLSADIEPLGENQFQFVKKPYYTFDDVVARAMVGTTERDCEYFVIAGPQPDSYPVYGGGKLKQKGRKVYVVTTYKDGLTAPAGAVSVKTQNETNYNFRPKSWIYEEINDQRKARSMRPSPSAYDNATD